MNNIQVKWLLNPQETLLYQGSALYITGKYSTKQGCLYITSERIVFERRPVFRLFQVIGGLFGRREKNLSFPLTAVTSFKATKYLLYKRAIQLELMDGVSYHFSGGKWEDIDAAYQKAILGAEPLLR
ncbi:hypothetical protein [Chitinophaga sp. RAB17]|uniref:hypothetical protein n=1 Tax=Chitinophaga sp. RAB17 TaxID=3233049 RepID=UPI003F8ED67D